MYILVVGAYSESTINHLSQVFHTIYILYIAHLQRRTQYIVIILV
jgi:hypothetical protein